MFLILYLVNRSVMAVIETVGGDIYLDLKHLTPGTTSSIDDTSFFFFYLGIGGLVVYFTIEFVAKKYSKINIMLLSFILTAAGCFVVITYNQNENLSYTRFTIGAVLVWSLGSPMCQVVILAAFCDVLGSGSQNIMMGWFTVAGSVGSIFSRAVTGVVSNNDLFYVSGVSSVLSAIALLLFIVINKKRGKSMESYSQFK